jgi:2-polyprenyl-3-methyl-5-hydroxy-6-metoxy-1,4-benzoquinol methylase
MGVISGHSREDRRRIREVLDEIYAVLPPEWTLKEGAQWYTQYVTYLTAIFREARAVARERGQEGFDGLCLLDVGFGMGVVACACAAAGMRVVGVDNEPHTDHPILRPLRERYHVEYHEYDAMKHDLPLASGSVDVVNSNDMIEHLHGSPRRMLAECMRVLRPGGRVVITTPNLGSLHNRLLLLAGKSVHVSITDWYANPAWERPIYTSHIREYTSGDLRYVLRQAGFAGVRVRSVSYLPGSPTTPPPGADRLDYTKWFSYLKDHPFHSRGFVPRGKRDLLFLGHHALTAVLPNARLELEAVGRKP